MTIVAHSQEEKVMPVKAVTGGALPELVFIFLGSDRWICFPPNPKNVFRGNWGMIKKRFLRRPVVALIAFGRNTAFIAETENPLVPGVTVAGERAVHRPWGVPTTQAKMKFAAFKNGDVRFSFNERNGISDEV